MSNILEGCLVLCVERWWWWSSLHFRSLAQAKKEQDIHLPDDLVPLGHLSDIIARHPLEKLQISSGFSWILKASLTHAQTKGPYLGRARRRRGRKEERLLLKPPLPMAGRALVSTSHWRSYQPHRAETWTHRSPGHDTWHLLLQPDISLFPLSPGWLIRSWQLLIILLGPWALSPNQVPINIQVTSLI